MATEFETFRQAADFARLLAAETQCSTRLSRSGEKWIVFSAQPDKPDLSTQATEGAVPEAAGPDPLPQEPLTPEDEWDKFWCLASRVEAGLGGTRADVAQAFSRLIQSGNATALSVQQELLKTEKTDGFMAEKYSSKTNFGRGLEVSYGYRVSGSFGSKDDVGSGSQ